MKPDMLAAQSPDADKWHHYRPFIGVLSGLPYAGKSTLGMHIGRVTNIAPLDIEAARFFDPDPNAFSRGTPEQEKSAMHVAYTRNHAWALQNLEARIPVLLIATYSRTTYHENLIELGASARVPIVAFRLTAPEPVIQERIEQSRANGHLSNIRTWGDYCEVRDRYVPLPITPLHEIDTSLSVAQNVAQIKTAFVPYEL